MKSRQPTVDELEWLTAIAQVGCVVCHYYHGAPNSPAEIHHLHGRTIEGAHLAAIPLCTRHHRIKDNEKPKRWYSRHGDGKADFEKHYAPEDYLLKLTHELVQGLRGNQI